MATVKLDITIKPSGDPLHDLEQIKRAERLGFDTVWLSEKAHNPFIPLTLAAKQTTKLRLGTQGAFAFPRSPMVTAQIAWDLARQSSGRFVLGLGTPAREQLERRFSEEWRDPVERMREYLESLRAIWDTFQTDARLRYRGKHYQFRLMAPFFNPGPIPHPTIPVYLAGDSPSCCQLAGELSQGLHAPALHTPSYLREVLLPAVENGLRLGNRTRREIAVTVPVRIISAEPDSERRRAKKALRQRLAQLASTATLRPVMRLHGWEPLADELSTLAREKQWAAVNDAIADEALQEFAVIGAPGEIYAQIVERYADIADRVSLEWDADKPALYQAIARSRG